MPGSFPASPKQFVWVVSGWGGQANDPDEFCLFDDVVYYSDLFLLVVISTPQ